MRLPDIPRMPSGFMQRDIFTVSDNPKVYEWSLNHQLGRNSGIRDWENKTIAVREFWHIERMGRGFGKGRNGRVTALMPSFYPAAHGEPAVLAVRVNQTMANPDQSEWVIDRSLMTKAVDANTRMMEEVERLLERAWIAVWCLHPRAGERVNTADQLVNQVKMLQALPSGWVGCDPAEFALMAALM